MYYGICASSELRRIGSTPRRCLAARGESQGMLCHNIYRSDYRYSRYWSCFGPWFDQLSCFSYAIQTSIRDCIKVAVGTLRHEPPIENIKWLEDPNYTHGLFQNG